MESCENVKESLSTQIDRLLKVDYISTNSLSSSIFKVPNHLRQINEAAYEPQAVSIGPYHHEKHNLKTMEVYKWHYLKMILKRRNETSVDRYVTELENMKGDARRFYSEPLDHIEDKKLVQMLLLDGCFIVELIRKSAMEELRGKDDPLLTHYILRTVLRDLLLVENQLPFFILSRLFELTMMPKDHDEGKNLLELAVDLFFSIDIIPGSSSGPSGTGNINININRDVKHLLDLIHGKCVAASSVEMIEGSGADHQLDPESLVARYAWCRPSIGPSIEFSSPLPMDSFAPGVRFGWPDSPVLPRFTERGNRPTKFLWGTKPAPSVIGREENYEKSEFIIIPSATELNEAGVKFKKKKKKLEGETSIFDITFDERKGVLSIPTLEIKDETESVLRNLVAYEQCCIHIPSKSKCFTQYVTFMDCLINTEKDVEFLSSHGVVENWLGDHQMVADLFNRICQYVLIPHTFCYTKIFKQVNKYCKQDLNRWMANLRHNYFNTPWALISFIAAVFLLLLTTMQSVYSALSYHFN